MGAFVAFAVFEGSEVFVVGVLKVEGGCDFFEIFLACSGLMLRDES